MPAPVMQFTPTASVVRKGNVGAGAETLLNIWIPPSMLVNNGDSLFMQGAVQLGANANAKSALLQFNGTTVAGRSASDNGAFYDMRARIYRVNGGLAMAFGLCNNSATSTQIGTNADIVTDFSLPLELKLIGQGVAADDVISRILKWAYIPVGTSIISL